MSEQHAELPEALQTDPEPTRKDENKPVYPGSLDRYRALRSEREASEAHGNYDPAMAICEALEGLAYLLDGIRYSARKQS
jgi:hypothetical protein